MRRKRKSARQSLSIFNVLLIFIVIVVLPGTGSSSPGLQDPRIETGMAATLVFPAGHSPDAQGNFQIEILCKSFSAFAKVTIKLTHSDEIQLQPIGAVDVNKTGSLFQGSIKKGVVKRWRMNGVISRNAVYQGEEIPASMILSLEYPCPRVAEPVETLFGVPIDRQHARNSQSTRSAKREQTETLCHLTKALPVWLN